MIKVNKAQAVVLVAAVGYLFGPEAGNLISAFVSSVEGVDKATLAVAAVAWTLPGPDKLLAKVKEKVVGKVVAEDAPK
jgi:hypothetical protein